jgi:hypothetical protein
VVLVVPSRPYSAWGGCTGIDHLHRPSVFLAVEQAGWHTYDRAVEEGKQPCSSPVYLDILRCVVVRTGTVQILTVSSLRFLFILMILIAVLYFDILTEGVTIPIELISHFLSHSDKMNSIPTFSILFSGCRESLHL